MGPGGRGRVLCRGSRGSGSRAWWRPCRGLVRGYRRDLGRSTAMAGAATACIGRWAVGCCLRRWRSRNRRGRCCSRCDCGPGSGRGRWRKAGRGGGCGHCGSRGGGLIRRRGRGGPVAGPSTTVAPVILVGTCQRCGVDSGRDCGRGDRGCGGLGRARSRVRRCYRVRDGGDVGSKAGCRLRGPALATTRAAWDGVSRAPLRRAPTRDAPTSGRSSDVGRVSKDASTVGWPNGCGGP